MMDDNLSNIQNFYNIWQCHHAVWHSSWYLSTDLVIKLVSMWSLKITRGRECWQDDKLTSKESAQHKTCSVARQQKDTDDANKIIEYLDSENPFDVTLSLCILLILVLLPINQGLLTCRTVRTKSPWQHDRLITRFQTIWSRSVTMLWQSTSGYIRYNMHRSTPAVPATHYCWCRYAKVWAIAMFLSSSTIWWCNDETCWDWWEACSRTDCNTKCCHCTT